MNVEVVSSLRGSKLNIWKEFLLKMGLSSDESVSKTVLVWDGETLAATGSRKDNLLKLIAVDTAYQGEDLTATVLSALRTNAFSEGYSHLFLYTKPENKDVFESLFFYSIARTDDVLMMENRKNGISSFLESMPASHNKGKVGALVMNCNPFTLGHRYLVEKASAECDHVYIFVLSEDKSEFSAADRFEMVKLGTEDLSNVTVLKTGPYLISSATFPTYFLKDRDRATDIQCMLDVEIFAKHFAPRFSVTHRYVGSEPLSAMTEKYNKVLKEYLPRHGIQCVEIDRLESGGIPVSASRARELIKSGDIESLKAILPSTTLEYLQTNDLM